MSAQQEPSGAMGGLRGMRRKAVQTTELVQTGFLPGNDGRLPLVITPAVDNVDLAAWCASHLEDVEGHLDRHGAILFRGFPLVGAEDFEAVASTIAGDLFAEYGDLPPEETGQKIYHSTPYPPDKMILFHNESSHFSSWPLRQFFFCVVPSQAQGETPLLDCREVYQKLDREIVEAFESKDLMYVRNFSEGVDVPWQDFFHTDDRAAVEETCAKAGMTCEWTELGLRVRQLAKGVRTHPRTGEKLFFNQVQLHHVACLDEETRTALRQLFADEDLPRNVYYGDGTPIPDEVMDRIGELYEELCVEAPWEAGDLIALDNMITAHARRPFVGERKIIVAMGRMMHAEDVAPAAA
ncbi:MAG TPA: TauD/TfdA family dioxygenase [Solirubrobacteraceae bacterium]|nr:TauD/TfdA family dioxygenase [Solirubrobacteraceae bacterium]